MPSDVAGAARELVYLGAPSTGARGGTQTLAAPWWFTGEDELRLVVVNSLTGVGVTLQGRFLPRGGARPEPFVHVVTPSADRMPSTFDRPLGEGFLLNCSLIVTSGAPLVGQTYVMLQVIRGSTGATIVLGCLLAGYVTAMQHIAYPGSPIESSIAGGGVTRVVTGTTPAAGAEISETVPAGARWELVSVTTALTTTGAGGARQALLYITPPAFVRLYAPQFTTVPISVTFALQWAQNQNFETVAPGTILTAGLPAGYTLLAGDVVHTSTVNLQAGDQYRSPVLVVREWLEAA